MIRRLLAARLRDERGVSLAEVLLASSLFVVVLGAALTPFELFHRTERANANQNESQVRTSS